MKGTKGKAGWTPAGAGSKSVIKGGRRDTQELLRQIVSRMTADRALREDLLQEARVHLWLRQKYVPGQTRSWYLQSCRFFLQNLLRNGRSLDSIKRNARVCPVSEAADEDEAERLHQVDDDPVLGMVSAREIARTLQKSLTPAEHSVFTGLAEGKGIREIASCLHVSHTSVQRLRTKIVAVALRLGVEPLPTCYGRASSPARPTVSAQG
jgi:DNA-directed RNA polymerase specialized sigma24 family protein